MKTSNNREKSKPLAPPHNEQTERAVLGCLLSSPECLAEAEALHPRGVFYSVENQEIFRSIRAVVEQGKSADPVNVSRNLTERKNREECYKFPALAQLAGEGVPAMFQSYLDELNGLYSRRQAMEIGRRIIAIAENETIPAEIISRDIESAVESIRGLSNSSALPPIADAADHFPDDVNDYVQLVEGVLDKGSKMVLGGGSKAYKTWGFIDLAVSVSSGANWWGFKTTRAKVLYLNFEIQPKYFRRRLKQVAEAKQIEVTPGWFKVHNLRGYCADFSKLLPEIAKQITGGDFGLIVIDPIYKGMAGRDENSAGDIADLLNQIERLTVQTGAAVVFGAHFSKGNQSGKESMDRISGSGVFARDPDSILVMTKHEEDNAFTVDATLRNFQPVEPFCVRWDFPMMKRDGNLDPKKLKQVGGRSKQHTEGKILELLGDRCLTATEWQVMALEKKIPRRTFYELKKTLVEAELIYESPETGKWERLKNK